jgi:hypothetical protein
MDAQSFLMGSGSPGFSFMERGDRIVGQVLTEPTLQQQKVYGTNDPAFWPSGDPKMQMLVQVQTNFRNYEGLANPDRTQPDSGTRTIYVKGKHFEKAAREAIRAAGARFIEVGGVIDVTYDGPDMSSKAGMKPKLFTVRYQAPLAQPAGTSHAEAQIARQAQYAQAPQYGQPQAPTGNPAWQQPGWRSDQQGHLDAQRSAAGYAPGGHVPGPMNVHASVSIPAVPSHHGSPENMPTWATEATPTSAPPAPQLSTLDMIRQSQGAAVSSQAVPVEADF